ncbi:hypothetical protein HUJ05_010941 [Dendroctonus ponderosae]|nr:hypothetical protein HUJ05_010941 [Dendroctonus ponderosae]
MATPHDAAQATRQQLLVLLSPVSEANLHLQTSALIFGKFRPVNWGPPAERISNDLPVEKAPEQALLASFSISSQTHLELMMVCLLDPWKRAQSLAPAFEASMGWTEGPVIHFWAPKLVHSLGKGLDGISGSAALPLRKGGPEGPRPGEQAFIVYPHLGGRQAPVRVTEPEIT